MFPFDDVIMQNGRRDVTLSRPWFHQPIHSNPGLNNGRGISIHFYHKPSKSDRLICSKHGITLDTEHTHCQQKLGNIYAMLRGYFNFDKQESNVYFKLFPLLNDMYTLKGRAPLNVAFYVLKYCMSWNIISVYKIPISGVRIKWLNWKIYALLYIDSFNYLPMSERIWRISFALHVIHDIWKLHTLK